MNSINKLIFFFLFAIILLQSCKDGSIKSNNKIVIPILLDRSSSFSQKEFLVVKKKYEELTNKIKNNPEKPESYILLAQLFINEARITGKHHEYIPSCMKLLNKSLELDSTNFNAKITKASVLMTLHKFNDAKTLAEEAIKLNGYSSFGYGVLVDALVETGDYKKAVEICDKLNMIKPDLRSYSRASYLREINCDFKGAIEAMELAADAGASGAEDRAWALFQLGNLYVKENKIDTAQFIFKGILEERPSYAFAFLGLADVAIYKKDFSTALELLIKAIQLSPEHIFSERLTEVYSKLNDTFGAKLMLDKTIVAFEIHQKDGWNIDREYANFCLKQNYKLVEALTLAKKDYLSRPENVVAQTTYAWALVSNNRLDEAKIIIDKSFITCKNNNQLLIIKSLLQSKLNQKNKFIS